jgi:GT2 family glycosyltransferase
MKVCVAIIERNEKHYIERTLSSILSASKHLNADVYVIDGHSTDGTIEFIRERFLPLGVKILLDENKGLGAAHNFALCRIPADIIFFTFGDEYVSNQWISSALRRLEDHEVGAVFGPSYILNSQKLLEKYADQKLKRYFSSLKLKPHFPYAAATNLAIKKDIALKVGGFRDDLIDADDSEFTFKVSKAGYKVVYEPNMIVYHQKANEGELRTLIRATMLVSFGYGQVAAMHGIKWHPICPIYALVLPTSLLWFILLFMQTLAAIYIALLVFTIVCNYFAFQAIKYKSKVLLLGILIELTKLPFAGISFLLGYIYQKSRNRFPTFAYIIKKVFDQIRLKRRCN